MNSLSIALIALVCIVGGALFGMFLSTLLPEHHFTSESKDTVKLGAGLIATMAALVLGLLVGSAKNSFDAMTNGITQISAKTIMLDRALAHYGPETQEVREMVRDTVGSAMRHIWPEEKNAPQHPAIPEKSDGMERIQSAILALAACRTSRRLSRRVSAYATKKAEFPRFSCFSEGVPLIFPTVDAIRPSASNSTPCKPASTRQ